MKSIKSDNNLYAGPNIFAAYQNLQKAQASLKTLFDAGLISQKHYSDTVSKLEDLTSMLYAPVFKNRASKIKSSSYVSKQVLQQAIDEYDRTNEMSDTLVNFVPQWIGQGYGYKSDKNWNEMKLDEVIYVPEYGYRKGNHIPENFYTKQDFIDIVGEEPRAKNLFDDVDWQFPETLAEEYDWQTDYWETGKDAPDEIILTYDENGNYISTETKKNK